MAFTIDDALKDELILVESRNDDLGIYEIKIGELDTLVTIELGVTPNGQFTKFSVSHAIHTPTQTGPYRTSRPFNDNPPSALHQAVTGLTTYYRDAIKKGHKPKETWLVKY